MRFSGIFQTISFTVRKRFVNAFLPPPYTVGKPSKNAPKRLKKFAMPAAKTRTLCRRLAAPSHQKTALYGHFSASCRFLHPKLQPVGPFLILCAFSQTLLPQPQNFYIFPPSHTKSAPAFPQARSFFSSWQGRVRLTLPRPLLLPHPQAPHSKGPSWKG